MKKADLQAHLDEITGNVPEFEIASPAALLILARAVAGVLRWLIERAA